MKHIRVTFVEGNEGFVDGSKIVGAVPSMYEGKFNYTELIMDLPAKVVFKVLETPIEVLKLIDECERFNLNRR